MHRSIAPLLAASSLFATAASAVAPPEAPVIPNAAELKAQNAKFAPVELKVDLAKLPANEKAALNEIIEAARIMDGIFLRQTWSGSPAMLSDLARDDSPLGRARLDAFLINQGPWLRIDHDKAFMPGVGAKPEQGNFYPRVTKDVIETWHKSLTAEQKERATGFFTTIRREGDKFLIVPYSTEYQGELADAAMHLTAAAALTTQPTLKKFLETRAAAFLSNDYYASDVAWMELDASIEPTIGPYEVYEDNWFNAKAAFESFIGLRDDAESQKLAKLADELQGLENALPLDAVLKNPKIGALAPIRVVNQLYCSGDANHGVQTAAYNLPNDERIAKERGTKRVMLKNVQEAKFHKTLEPIAKIVLSPADQKLLSFDAFFTHILMHELMHGLGPHTVAGKQTTVREAMQEAGSALEEAKADISGLWALQKLVDKGTIGKDIARTMYVTYVASSFRTLRFGLNEAHGRGMALQLNYLLDAGAVTVSKTGQFSVDGKKIVGAVEGLTKKIMELQSSGDAAAARTWLATATLRPEVEKAIAKLTNLPVDIRPIFTTANALRAETAGKK